MANELQLTAVSGNTIYAIIRDPNTAEVWDAVAGTWDTWANADIGDYDIAMVDNGGDYYSGTFPAAIAVGTYRIMYYLQDGVAPAISDVVLNTVRQYWNGSGLTPPPVAGGDLITAEEAIREPELSGFTAGDERLDQLIAVASEHVKWYLQRYFTVSQATNAEAGIKFATARVAAQLYVRARLSDQYDSESLADYSYTRSKRAGNDSWITPMVREILWPYAAQRSIFVPEPS